MNKQQSQAIKDIVQSIIDDMKDVSMSTKKIETMAYIDAWQNDLKTINYIINL